VLDHQLAKHTYIAGDEYTVADIATWCSAAEKGEWIAPHLWSGLTRFRPGAGIAVVGDPHQCAATLQQFIDAGCTSFCLSGYLHDEEAERFGRLVRPLLENSSI